MIMIEFIYFFDVAALEYIFVTQAAYVLAKVDI